MRLFVQRLTLSALSGHRHLVLFKVAARGHESKQRGLILKKKKKMLGVSQCKKQAALTYFCLVEKSPHRTKRIPASNSQLFVAIMQHFGSINERIIGYKKKKKERKRNHKVKPSQVQISSSEK